MPGLISVSEFVEESREDVDSPTTSTFVSRMSQCRQTVAALEEVTKTCFVLESFALLDRLGYLVRLVRKVRFENRLKSK